VSGIWLAYGRDQWRTALSKRTNVQILWKTGNFFSTWLSWLSWVNLYVIWIFDVSCCQQRGYHDYCKHYWNTSLNIAVRERGTVSRNGVAFSDINHSALMNIHCSVNNWSRQVTCTNFGFSEQGYSKPLITRHELLIFLLTKIRNNRPYKALQKAHYLSVEYGGFVRTARNVAGYIKL
jgi:hypothetical protein